ncbi:type II toxin-antitoxin system RelE family toxin [Desulfobacula toluolica]|uniref:Plasmid stabilization system protein n=1 Tax=Desulfobacula toluolica (strain DSM 7467 / Tol2) TaxID=651182 RepID=K0N4B1_DESTT|nr:type II toxin-antitoxin system RelE/ParE family toxin [Desulfobacula toluolica]CCK78949.1 plasmid stabilization system protein [Desulfobacula toluolica Tol2]
MKWEIIYHKDVDDDLKSVGPSAAKRIIHTINKKLTCEPEKFGVPLSHNLKDFQKLRIGDFRLVYQVFQKKVIVFVLAVGPRRDKEIYRSASDRL